SDALQCYQRALAIAPTSPDAFQGLERLFLGSENYPALAELYESTYAATDELTRRAGMLWTLATLYDARLDDQVKALETLEKYRKLRPNDLAALWMIQRIHGQQQAWTELI